MLNAIRQKPSGAWLFVVCVLVWGVVSSGLDEMEGVKGGGRWDICIESRNAVYVSTFLPRAKVCRSSMEAEKVETWGSLREDHSFIHILSIKIKSFSSVGIPLSATKKERQREVFLIATDGFREARPIPILKVLAKVPLIAR